MNPKSVIAYIEKSRSVLEAQAAKLSEIAPHPAKDQHTTNDGASDAAQLVAAHLAAQLATAADWLRTLSDTEAAVRAAQKSSEAEQRDPKVIDADYREISQ